MIGAGFRLLNLLPQSSEHFLRFAEQHGLQNKYVVARDFWASMRGHVEDANGWLDAIAATEAALLELREPRPRSAPPECETDRVAMPTGVRFIQLEPDTLSLQDSLPEQSLPTALAAAELTRLCLMCPRRPPAPQRILFLPGVGDAPEGRLIQINDELAAALTDAAGGEWSVAAIGARIGTDTVTNLIELGALSRCLRP
jgi:hypothetical protein